MVLDFTNKLIQTNMTPNKDVKEMVIMKITGVLVDMLVRLDSETYRKHVVFGNGKKLIYIVLLREIYGMVVAALLFYKNFCVDLKILGLSSILTIHVSRTG